MYQIKNALLSPNKYSRPQKPLRQIKAIVIHWVANPNSTAMENRNYFENRKNGNDDYGSCHEIIDLDNSIVVCVPENEITYNCGSPTYTQRCLNELGNSPNYCTYGIECTHIDNAGLMTAKTYQTLIERCIDLCIKWNLNPLTALWTHQEVVGWKDCHRWFVNNPNEWKIFKQKVLDGLKLKLQSSPAPWQIDCMNFLSQQGYITQQHSFDKVINFRTFAYMMNNVTLNQSNILPITWLIENRYITSQHHELEELTLSLFGYIVGNRFKESITMSPIDYLVKNGFLNQKRNDEKLSMWLFGAMMKNAFSKGIKL